MQEQHHQPTKKGSLSHASFFRRHVKIPINGSILAIPFLQPLIRLFEMAASELEH